MRNPLRTARRIPGGQALAAASLAGVMAVTGTTLASADTAEPVVAPVAPPVLEAPAVATPVEAEPLAEKRGILAAANAKRAALAAKVAKVRSLRSKVVDIAKDQVGDRYRTGSSGPDAFDCSGLTRYVYKKATGKDLPHSSRAQYGVVKRIKAKEARPGDLVFFFRNGARHVGVYIGGGKMVHAKGAGRGVKVDPVSGSWYSRSISGYGRIIAEPAAA